MKDNKDLEKETALEELWEEEEPAGIAMELLHDFKEHSKRMDEHNQRLISVIKTMAISFSVLIAALVLGFFLYLYQYDFQSYTQDGGYNNINTGTQGDVNNGTEIPDSEEEGR